MAAPMLPKPAKLIIAILDAGETVAPAVYARLVATFGEMDYASPRFSFTATKYYDAEMGTPLQRQFFACANLIAPDALPACKRRTNEIENEFAVAGKRRVNLDPGYLDADKFVLASAKPHGYKIYLAQGIWADMALHYEKGRFTALPWSFPDYRSGQYEQTFLRIREIYKQQLQSHYA